MNIIGEKVLLRAIEKNDSEALRNIMNDPDTEIMLGGISYPVSEDAQDKWINTLSSDSTTLRCIIADKNAPNEAIGTVILSDIDYINGSAEVHIKLSNSNKRKCGYGHDSITSITKYAFEFLRLHCIYANVISYNIPSQKLFEKCGFIKEGILKDRIFKLGKYNDIVVYSKINEEK